MSLMSRARLLAAIVAISVGVLLWLNRPHKVDMAGYAPADSLVFLEAKSVKDLAIGLSKTDAWNNIAPLLGISDQWNSRLVDIAGWTGIGPVETVVAARAQLALVILNVSTNEEGDTLRVKPEAALLVETHTSGFRIRTLVEQRLQQLAEGAYGKTSFKKTNVSGNEFLTWTNASSSRELVAVIDGSLIIVGNSQNVVATCLAVRHGERPNLRSDPELQQMRQTIGAEKALAFGFVSSANAARLVSVAGPLLLGRSEVNTDQLGRLLANAAGKIFGTIGWGTFSSNGLIEDRYLFKLQHPVIDRLQPAFSATQNDKLPYQFLPVRPYSITEYRYQDPLTAWKSFESAGLARLDALSAAVFKTLLDSALAPYGIDKPELFLQQVGPPLLTVRLQAGVERSLIIAPIIHKDALRQFVVQRLGPQQKHDSIGSAEILEAEDGEWSAAFAGNYLLMGALDDVKSCLETSDRSTENSASVLPSFDSITTSAPIVTYTNDSARVRNFFRVFSKGADAKLSSKNNIEQAFDRLPYAVTETTLVNDGIMRRTRSPLGQFSTLAELVFPEKTDD